MTLPDWNDDEALANVVGPLRPKKPRDWLIMPWDEWWGGLFTEPDRQREAIAAARQGNFKLLGALVDQGESWGQEAKDLIAARLRGEFKVKKPGSKKSGRPKQTDARRRANNPIHHAADEVPDIKDILRRLYPGRRGYYERAIDIAAKLFGVGRERLAKHIESPHRLDAPTKIRFR